MSKPTYDTDFYAWTQEQAAQLRAKVWEDLDLENLPEEIEALGKSDRRAVQSHLVVLIQHLLKWAYQPQQRERYGAGWQAGIDEDFWPEGSHDNAPDTSLGAASTCPCSPGALRSVHPFETAAAAGSMRPWGSGCRGSSSASRRRTAAP